MEYPVLTRLQATIKTVLFRTAALLLGLSLIACDGQSASVIPAERYQVDPTQAQRRASDLAQALGLQEYRILSAGNNAELSVTAGSPEYGDSGVLINLAGSVRLREAAVLQKSLWVQRGGPQASLINAQNLIAQVVLPDVVTPTRLTFALVAADSEGYVADDTVTITVLPITQYFSYSIRQSGVSTDPTIEVALLFDSTSNRPETVHFRTEDGTAEAGRDYRAHSGTLNSSEDSNVITLQLFPSPNSAGDRYFSLIFSASSGNFPRRSITIVIPSASTPELTNAITAVKPTHAAPGTIVELSLSGRLEAQAQLRLNGAPIPDFQVFENRATFTVPKTAQSGPLQIVSSTGKSNAVWFQISTDWFTPPAQESRSRGLFGASMVTSYLLVGVDPASQSRPSAQALAESVEGEIIGHISSLGLWQIGVQVEDHEALEALTQNLIQHPGVLYVLPDVWLDNTPQVHHLPLETQTGNYLEEGIAFYQQQFSPTDAEKRQPYFMDMGFTQAGLDYSRSNFVRYLQQNNGMDGNLSLYAPHSFTPIEAPENYRLSDNILAMVAGAGSAGSGVLQQLKRAHGGANLTVTPARTFGEQLAYTLQLARSGAKTVLWTWDLYQSVNFPSAVTEACPEPIWPTQLVLGQDWYDGYHSLLTGFMDTLASRYPSTLIVSQAGDHGNSAPLILGSHLPSSVQHNQLLSVTAHYQHSLLSDLEFLSSCYEPPSVEGMSRAPYANFGAHIDIAASGSFSAITGRGDGERHSTAYAAVTVAVTSALMQSIAPSLSPVQIKQLLRRTSSPFGGEMDGPDYYRVTRPLTAQESMLYEGQSARLNIPAALAAVLGIRAESTIESGDRLQVTIPAGQQSVQQRVRFSIPADRSSIFDKVDILFLVDVSGSYGSDLATFRSQAADLINAFNSGGADVHVGLASFSDFPIDGYGEPTDYPYRLDQSLTDDFIGFASALNGLELLNGGDEPESQLEALFQASQSATGWRAGSLPLIFLATDASFHDSDRDPNYPGAGYTATLQALTDRGIRIFGMQSGNEVPDVLRITADTGGEAFRLSSDSAEILAAVEAALEGVSKEIFVALTAASDRFGLVHDIHALSGEITERGIRITPGEEIEFEITFSRNGLTPTTASVYSVSLHLTADKVATLQHRPITVILEGE